MIFPKTALTVKSWLDPSSKLNFKTKKSHSPLPSNFLFLGLSFAVCLSSESCTVHKILYWLYCIWLYMKNTHGESSPPPNPLLVPHPLLLPPCLPYFQASFTPLIVTLKSPKELYASNFIQYVIFELYYSLFLSSVSLPLSNKKWTVSFVILPISGKVGFENSVVFLFLM